MNQLDVRYTCSTPRMFAYAAPLRAQLLIVWAAALAADPKGGFQSPVGPHEEIVFNSWCMKY